MLGMENNAGGILPALTQHHSERPTETQAYSFRPKKLKKEEKSNEIDYVIHDQQVGVYQNTNRKARGASALIATVNG